MRLTDDEQAMLDGAQGPLAQKCMQILVTLGEVYGAERMLPVSSVHSPGVSYRVAGDAGLAYLREAADSGAFQVPTTLNTGGIDRFAWEDLEFPRDFAQCQMELGAAYERMGAIGTYTCTPYLCGNVPAFGEHVAWGESSAIAYVNSVLGARTNREGGPSALAAAVTGRVPAYGYHLDENRSATHLVRVNTALGSDRDFAVLGYAIGPIVGRGVPVFAGISERPSLENFKALGAALASSGAVALFHVAGFTPEAPTVEAILRKEHEVVDFGPDEYARVVAKFSPPGPVDAVVIGCPHCSIGEMRALADALDGKQVAVDVIVCVSHPVFALAESIGLVATITDAGATIVRDTCPVLGPTLDRGYRTVATNSGKLAHYMPGLWHVDTALLQFDECIDAALAGGAR